MTNYYTLGQRKSTFTLALGDGREVLLTVPPLGVFKRMIALRDNVGVDDMIEIVCAILNCNLSGATFTPEDVGALFAFDDLVGFFGQYSDFVANVTKAKN